MQGFKNSWFLARFDIVSNGIGYFWSLLFFVYASVMIAFMLQDTSGADDSRILGAGLIVDFYFICVLACCGFAFASRYYRSYWRSKSFSKKAAFLKSFPISASETMDSRIMLVIIHVLGQGLLFFSVIFFVPSPIQEMLSGLQFFEFIVFWMAYAMVWGCIYAYMEISISEKAYLWGSFIIVGFFSVIVFLGWLLDYSIVGRSIYWIQQWGIFVPLFALVIGGLAVLLFRSAGIKIINARDLHL